VVAVIEIGTHSVKCLRDGRDAVVVTRLGEGLARTGRIAPAAAARTLRVVRRFLRDGPAAIVATHALRTAQNRRDVLRRWGLPVRVLTSEEEAHYSYRGATSGLGRGPFVTVDVGGGSTEVATPRFHVSVPWGAATLTQRCVTHHPIPHGEARAMVRRICMARRRIPWRRLRARAVVAVGGTAVTIASVARGGSGVEGLHGRRLRVADLVGWFGYLGTMSLRERCRIPGIDRGRADILPAGLLLLLIVVGRPVSRSVLISTRGVRHGVALEMRGKL
jgi:exopolyphosphatase/guanosine-5'-triphosphate,3'-diphosphate pyrophosphatase